MSDADKSPGGMLFARLQIADMLSSGSPDSPPKSAVGARRIVEYAHRPAGHAFFESDVERLIRNSAGARALYMRALAAKGAVSQRAAAAASDDEIVRKIGDHELRLVRRDGQNDYLVIELGHDSVPSVIELRRDDGSAVRLALPEPMNGFVQLGLDPRFEDLKQMSELLADPHTAIFLG
ncbi:hypothetical protein GEU84_020320 [Fertoebacter nigrum]|uniref:Uncharacterized protein n=1 Tax=Fertoeibacter niger TaxID=2656921 RepID=A0A8X8H5C1_9RHOB|nr:hypothetical protein [Fertoeibacter niger]NUB46742.1 hypothetical protein [Fertoeibacter niger]